MVIEMELHPAAQIPPGMSDDDYVALRDDVEANGLLEDIVTTDGMILDGRHRHRACMDTGTPPRFREWAGECGSPTLFVLSMSKRRNLTASQKAMMAQDALPILKKEAAARKAEKAAAAGRARGGINSALDGGNPATIQSENVGAVADAMHARSKSESRKARDEAAALLNVSPRYVQDGAAIKAASPALAEEVKAGTKTIPQAKRELRKLEVTQALEDVATKEAKEAEGVYDVVVIDPPWDMKKIERDCAPNQVEFDYPTMSEEELASLQIPTAKNAHVWVWTTHKFLPMALRLLGDWGLKYVCTFTWHKPGGFQPFGLPQYNCEFSLYARAGSPQFVETKAFPVCFNAKRGKHSEKPGEFYDVVRRVTAGRRLDMFNRRSIDGFDGWGNEAPE